MKKITLFLSFLLSGIIFAQTLEMPNIPDGGVNYETLTLDSYLTISTTGPWARTTTPAMHGAYS